MSILRLRAHRDVGIAKSDRSLWLRRAENHTGVVITNLAIVSLDEGYFPFNSAKYDASLQFPHARRRGRQSEIAIGPSILSGGPSPFFLRTLWISLGRPLVRCPLPTNASYRTYKQKQPRFRVIIRRDINFASRQRDVRASCFSSSLTLGASSMQSRDTDYADSTVPLVRFIPPYIPPRHSMYSADILAPPRRQYSKTTPRQYDCAGLVKPWYGSPPAFPPNVRVGPPVSSKRPMSFL